MEEKKYSFYLDQALELLSSASDSTLDCEDRLHKSLEIAEHIILLANQVQTLEEKKKITYYNKILSSPRGKVFVSNLLDQSFRSSSRPKILDQMSYLSHIYGMPQSFPGFLKARLFTINFLGKVFPHFFATIMQKILINGALNALNFADNFYLHKYLQANKESEIVLTLIHPPSFGPKTIEKHLRNILKLIYNPQIKTICINIADLSSFRKFNMTYEELEENLKKIYRAALKADKDKLIIINIENHSELDITIEVLKKILLLSEFLEVKIGISLQAYFPESFEIQKELIEEAKKRLEKNGAPILIRITKGEKLTQEQISAAINNWPSPTYLSKVETDANFKKMLLLGCDEVNTKAANIAIVTSNVFDISFALLLIKEKNLEPSVYFEIAEGRSRNALRKALEKLIGKNLKVLCPIVFKKKFHLACNFLLGKINDVTNSENIVSQLNNLYPGTKNWEEQSDNFKQSLEMIDKISNKRKQKHNRDKIVKISNQINFENEPSTDFSIKTNILWSEKIIEKAKEHTIDDIPLIINGEKIKTTYIGFGNNPSNPKTTFYKYFLADENQIERAIKTAKENEKKWSQTPLEKRCEILLRVAQKLREKRSFFIQTLIVDIGKNISEADMEVSDAIDVIEYQTKHMLEISRAKKDIKFEPKGTFLIKPSWKFPLSTAAEEIASALVSGNTLILKPLSSCPLVCYQLVLLMYEALVPKETLQYLNCSDELFEKKLIADPRIDSVVIFTSAKEAKKLISLRNGLEISAITGGTNTIIVTANSDKEQAIKAIIDSAFSFSGQKFSSASILILEKELYNDLEFKNYLKDAAQNLIVGSAFDPSVTVTPLIDEPDAELKRALLSLDKNESWLLKPKIDKDNPNLFSPGIKYGVQIDSFTKTHELYGPILSVMEANDLDEAIKIANTSKYALSSSLHSLDIRQHAKWLNNIQGGNYFINTKNLNAKVKRQPFGGYKDSSFGSGYKSGGPNYILNFVNLTQIDLPKGKLPVNDWVNSLTSFLENMDLSFEQLGVWYASVANYAYYWKRLKLEVDHSKILGQDNIQHYIPRQNITLRLNKDTFALDALRVCAAALTCSAPLEISWTSFKLLEEFNWIDLLPILSNIEESEDEFIARIKEGKIKRLRLTTKASDKLKKAAANSACYIIDKPVLANGRLELLHYIKEVSITYDYYRYENLGIKESEMRKPLL